MSASPVSIRRASRTDQASITALVHSERLNPHDLDWRRFVVATDRFGLAGAVQIRRHVNECREMGSLVVRRDARQRGVAARMIDAVLASETGRVFMITGAAFAARYARWGFQRIAANDAPGPVWRNYLMGQLMSVVSFVIGRSPKRLVVLDRRPRTPRPQPRVTTVAARDELCRMNVALPFGLPSIRPLADG